MVPFYIYAFTYSVETEKDAGWTPMMFRLRDVLYEEYEKEISDAEKEQKIKNFENPDNQEDFVDFLYLNGQDKSWNWRLNAMTNAAFIINLFGSPKADLERCLFGA